MYRHFIEITGLFFLAIVALSILLAGGWYACYHLGLKDIDFISKQYRKFILREKLSQYERSEQFRAFEEAQKNSKAKGSPSSS